MGLFWENAFWKIQIFIPKIFRLQKIFGGPSGQLLFSAPNWFFNSCLSYWKGVEKSIWCSMGCCMCQYANDINLQHLGLQHAASPRGVFLACAEYYWLHVSIMQCCDMDLQSVEQIISMVVVELWKVRLGTSATINQDMKIFYNKTLLLFCASTFAQHFFKFILIHSESKKEKL